MAAKNRRLARGAPGRRAKGLMLAIPEDVVTRLIDPEQVTAADDAEVDTALTNAIDAAIGEIAEALVATDRSLASLHALRVAAEERGHRQGYREGVLAAGWTVHALARDLGKGKRAGE
jgi:hypothetical protein